MQKFLQYFKNELFLQEIALFSFAQFLGVVLVRRMEQFFRAAEQTIHPLTITDFAIYFLIGTILMVVFSRKSFLSFIITRIFFILLLFLGANLLFSLFINPQSAFYLAGAFVILRFVFPIIFLHNISFLFSVVIFSIMLSLSLRPMTTVILLAIFAVYDIAAVYLTEHMIKMAKAMIEMRTFFGFIIPEKIKYSFEWIQKARPGIGVIFLGGGDIGLPLILTANVALTSTTDSFVVAIFAALGMALSYYLFVSQRFKNPMPALPPISMMAILGYILTKVI